jgi:hypothetical protein
MCADAEMLWLLRQNYARIRSPRDRTSAEEDGRTQTMGVSVVVIIDEAETVKKMPVRSVAVFADVSAEDCACEKRGRAGLEGKEMVVKGEV